MNRVIISIPKFSSTFFAVSRKLSSTSKFQPVTHCLFDMDGLILHTEHIYENSVREICAKYGKDYPLDIRMKVMGTQAEKSAEIVIANLSLPIKVPEFLKLQSSIVRKHFNSVDLMDGAERLIRHLHETKVPFCLATSSGRELAELKMSNYPDLFRLFSHHVMGASDPEVKEGKPAPDIFLVAAARFKDKPHPSKCLVFEDSPNGVRAGKLAQMHTVMVPDKRVSMEHRKEATIVLDSLQQFQPELFGLPKFRN